MCPLPCHYRRWNLLLLCRVHALGSYFGVNVEWRFTLSGGAGPEGAAAFRIGAEREWGSQVSWGTTIILGIPLGPPMDLNTGQTMNQVWGAWMPSRLYFLPSFVSLFFPLAKERWWSSGQGTQVPDLMHQTRPLVSWAPSTPSLNPSVATPFIVSCHSSLWRVSPSSLLLSRLLCIPYNLKLFKTWHPFFVPSQGAALRPAQCLSHSAKGQQGGTGCPLLAALGFHHFPAVEEP